MSNEGRAKVSTYSLEPVAEGGYKICDRCDKYLASGDNSYLCHVTRSTFCSVECLDEDKKLKQFKQSQAAELQSKKLLEVEDWKSIKDLRPSVGKNILVKVVKDEKDEVLFFAGKVFAGSTGRLVVYCKALRTTRALEGDMDWKYLDQE